MFSRHCNKPEVFAELFSNSDPAVAFFYQNTNGYWSKKLSTPKGNRALIYV